MTSRSASAWLHAAEKIKIGYGAAIAEMVRPDEYIEAPSVGGLEAPVASGAGGNLNPAWRNPHAPDQELVRSGLKNMIGAGVVLTGRTALIQGCQSSTNKSSNRTRIGYPRQCGPKDMVNSPKFAYGLGLLRFGAEKEGMEQKFRIRSGKGMYLI